MISLCRERLSIVRLYGAWRSWGLRRVLARSFATRLGASCVFVFFVVRCLVLWLRLLPGLRRFVPTPRVARSVLHGSGPSLLFVWESSGSGQTAREQGVNRVDIASVIAEPQGRNCVVGLCGRSTGSDLVGQVGVVRRVSSMPRKWSWRGYSFATTRSAGKEASSG